MKNLIPTEIVEEDQEEDLDQEDPGPGETQEEEVHEAVVPGVRSLSLVMLRWWIATGCCG